MLRPVFTGHAVSQFVPVLFSNLITRISFSQPYFDPSSGQTQQVSAVFAANCDWTLNIVDVYSNVVQTASGSGISMLYNWDGTSNGVEHSRWNLLLLHLCPNQRPIEPSRQWRLKRRQRQRQSAFTRYAFFIVFQFRFFRIVGNVG